MLERSPLPPPGADATACAVVSARLNAQRRLGDLAVLLATVNGAAAILLAVSFLRSQPALAGAVMLAVLAIAAAERYLAVRIDLDARLFAWIAAQADVETALVGLDAALLASGLVPAATAGRPLRPRLHGSADLLRWHGAFVAVQALLLPTLASVMIGLWQ